MSLDKAISKISATVASIVVFVFAFGMYLSSKGFELNNTGQLVLVKAANASETFAKKIDSKAPLPNGHLLGDPKAPASIYEFSSFSCYHCADFHKNYLPQIKKEIIDTKKANFYFINFPLNATSMQGALIADCLPKDKFFNYIDKVFNNQKKLIIAKSAKKYLTEYAVDLGLSEKKIKQCISDEKNAQNILANRQNSMKFFGIEGTPSFLIIKGKERFLFEGTPSVENLLKILNKN